MHEWGPGHQGHQEGWGMPSRRLRCTAQPCNQRGWGVPCNHCLCLTTNPQRKCSSTGVWSQGWRGQDHQAFMEAFGAAIWSLSARDPWGTYVPPTAPDWWHALSHHSRNVSHCSTVGSGEWRTDAISSHPKCIRGMPRDTTSVSEMPTPLMGVKCQHHSSDHGSTHAKTRRGGDSWIRWHSQRVTLLEMERGEAHGKASKREFIGRPSLRSQNSSEWPGEPTTRPTSLTMSRRGHTTSPVPSEKWPPLPTSWALRSMKWRRHGLARKTSELLTMWPRPPQRTSTSLGSCCLPNHLRSWAWGGSIPPRPCNGRVGCPSVHGAGKKGRMKVWW